MVFMGNGGAKEGEDAIAERLGHIAFVAMHRFHHEPQGRINNLASSQPIRTGGGYVSLRPDVRRARKGLDARMRAAVFSLYFTPGTV
jgi:hypothetical protein